MTREGLIKSVADCIEHLAEAVVLHSARPDDEFAIHMRQRRRDELEQMLGDLVPPELPGARKLDAVWRALLQGDK